MKALTIKIKQRESDDGTPCGSVKCKNMAAVVVMWPGQPTPMCPECMKRAQYVNNAMGGVPLPIIPLGTPMLKVG